MADSNMNVSQGFGWDDEVEESEFELVPDGDYEFEVTAFERAWFEPKSADSKIPACNQANIEFTIKWVNDQGKLKTNKLTHRLKLCDNLAWLIYQFFECIGLVKKGSGKVKFPWNDIIGKKGICEIRHEKGSKGNDYNTIVKCYTPENTPNVIKNNDASAAPKFNL